MTTSLRTWGAAALVAAFALTPFACSDDPDTEGIADAANAGGADGSVAEADDAATQPPDAAANKPDAGAAGVPDGAVFVAVPTINNQKAAGHPQPSTQASPTPALWVKAVTTSARWRMDKSINTSDPRRSFCLYGVFVADFDAQTAEYNGLLVVSRSTVDATTKNCNDDAALPGSLESVASIGTELAVNGVYKERCGNFFAGECKDLTPGGTAITYPQLEANAPGSVVVGPMRGLPASLPATVSISQIQSSVGCAPFTLGADWWKYRGVLVKVEQVHPVDFNADDPLECSTDRACTDASGASKPCDYCMWRIGPQGSSTVEGSLRVSNELDWTPTNSCHRPTTDVAYDSLAGILYWSFGDSVLLPRKLGDAQPPLP